MMVLVLYGLSLLLFILILLWILVPAFYGLPPVPTKPERIHKALRLVNLKQDEMLYDLGAGDGRVLFIAAREFSARAVGIEIGPIQCAWIWLRIAASGLGQRIRVRWENFYHADLREADVVFLYATSKEIQKLAPHLERQMRPGARLISISADFPDWEPSAFDERDLIFIYEMPPARGSVMTHLLKKTS